MGLTDQEYDFIIVGAGASGSVLASRLSRTAQRPSVLLIEAGGSNSGAEYLVPADRFSLAFSQPSMNWGYKTAPQTHLSGQEIDYSRGKGLGGSTAINFSCWILGPKDDYDSWAEITGDEEWRWEKVKERVKRIETYHVEVPEEHRKFIDPKTEDHGTNGPLHLSYADPWERGLENIFVAAEEVGFNVNKDVNNGDPIGMGLGAGCMYQGARTTASDFLKEPPSNLTIMTDTPIHKVLVNNSKSVGGILTIDGRKVYARKEVILSAGALNTPQILMLSGIGPREELENHNIPIVQEMSQIGQNLQDHSFAGSTLIQKEGTSDRMMHEGDVEGMKRLRAQHAKDRSGVLNSMYCSTPMGFFKSDRIIGSEEFKALPKEEQKRIQGATVPQFEIATHVPPLFLGGYELKPKDSYLCAMAFIMNPQSTGYVTLASNNPNNSPIIQPNLAIHPYDRRVIIEAMKNLWKLLEAPVLKRDTVEMVGVPKGRRDEEIWEYVSSCLTSSWHMCKTVKMGKPDDATASTNIDFRLRGIKNLRIVDLSVMPLLINNHTQSTAYIIGEAAAEKIIKEYGLEEISQRPGELL